MSNTIIIISLLKQIISCINKIEWFLRDVDFEGFCGNQILIDYVLNNMDQISAAALQVPRNTQLLYRGVKWKRLIDLRAAVTISNNEAIDVAQLWREKENLPKIQKRVQKMLDDLREYEYSLNRID